MMLREWVKDTREALERAAELSRKPKCPPRPAGVSAGDLEREAGGREAGFGCGPTGWSRTIRRFGRSGRPHRADQGEDRGDLSGASGAPGAVSSNDRFLRRHGDDAGGTRSVD